MQILGLQVMQGRSKSTGKPYDAVVLFGSRVDAGVIGVRTEDVWVPRQLWDDMVASEPSEAFLGLEAYPSYDKRGFLQEIVIK